MNYMIYCKSRTGKERWGACDLSTGDWGVKLLFATMFRTLERAKEVCDSLTAENPKLMFQVRVAGKSTVVYAP